MKNLHIVAVHGAGMGPGVWGGLLPHLAAAGYGNAFQAVALPGHMPGAAEEHLLPDVAAMAAWLGEKISATKRVGPVVLMGHSLGAAVIMAAAASLKSLPVAGVVALGCGLRLPVNSALLALAADDPAAAREKMLSWSCDPSHPQHDGVKSIVADLFAAAPAGALAVDLSACDAFAAPAALGLPLLVVAGEKDRMVPAAACAELANALGGEYAEVPGGHMMLVERAPETARAVIRFLDGLL